MKKVLSLRERMLGEDHEDVAESLVNLAVLTNKKVLWRHSDVDMRAPSGTRGTSE